MNVTVRNVDGEAYRSLKAQAALMDITIGEAFSEAARLWIEAADSDIEDILMERTVQSDSGSVELILDELGPAHSARSAMRPIDERSPTSGEVQKKRIEGWMDFLRTYRRLKNNLELDKDRIEGLGPDSMAHNLSHALAKRRSKGNTRD